MFVRAVPRVRQEELVDVVRRHSDTTASITRVNWSAVQQDKSIAWALDHTTRQLREAYQRHARGAGLRRTSNTEDSNDTTDSESEEEAAEEFEEEQVDCELETEPQPQEGGGTTTFVVDHDHDDEEEVFDIDAYGEEDEEEAKDEKVDTGLCNFFHSCNHAKKDGGAYCNYHTL